MRHVQRVGNHPARLLGHLYIGQVDGQNLVYHAGFVGMVTSTRYMGMLESIRIMRVPPAARGHRPGSHDLGQQFPMSAVGNVEALAERMISRAGLSAASARIRRGWPGAHSKMVMPVALGD